jgi:hypothetical protein
MGALDAVDGLQGDSDALRVQAKGAAGDHPVYPSRNLYPPVGDRSPIACGDLTGARLRSRDVEIALWILADPGEGQGR